MIIHLILLIHPNCLLLQKFLYFDDVSKNDRKVARVIHFVLMFVMCQIDKHI